MTGETQEDATTALESAGFVVGDVTEVADDDVPAGSVVSQDPAARRRRRTKAPPSP